MILDLLRLNEKYNCNFNGVLHVGAHHGQEYKTYKDLEINPIVFIEALPHTYEILRSNVGQECLCINTAIGNIVGEIEMFVDEANLGGSSSILKPKIHLHQYPHITFPKNIKVPITKIDLLNIPKCNFINMDIQGYELEALKGAKDYLNTVDYVMLEVNRDEVYEGCAHIDEIDTYLEKYSFIRIETDWAGNTWGDAFYIKNKS
jgi:FkbM family methyltransferase